MTLYSPKGYGFDEILSSPQLTGSGMPTEISFSIPQSPEKWIVGKHSYISMKLNITMTDEAGNVGPLRPIVNNGTRIAPLPSQYRIYQSILGYAFGIMVFAMLILNRFHLILKYNKRIRYIERFLNQRLKIRLLMLKTV